MEMRNRSAKPSPPPNPALPYREDCWSDGETAALVDAWGTRFVAVGRGILRQPQWQEVADAVNGRPSARTSRRPPRSDSQCKNRVDTLKKKYKKEKEAGGSSWQFYPRMDELLKDYVPPTGAKKSSPSSGRSKKSLPSSASQIPLGIKMWHPSESKSPSPPRRFPVTPPLYKKESKQESPLLSEDSPSPPPHSNAFDDSVFRKAAAAAAAAKYEDVDVMSSDNEDDAPPLLAPAKLATYSDDSDDEVPPAIVHRSASRNGAKRKRGDADGGFHELAKAIDMMAATYERVEMEGLRRAAEMAEKQREFMKEMELERMRMFMEAQVQLASKCKQLKREKTINHLGSDGNSCALSRDC